MNRTDQFSDADIEQGIKNFEAVARILKAIRDSLTKRDPMRWTITEVIGFLNTQVEQNRKLLVNPRIEVVEK